VLWRLIPRFTPRGAVTNCFNNSQSSPWSHVALSDRIVPREIEQLSAALGTGVDEENDRVAFAVRNWLGWLPHPKELR